MKIDDVKLTRWLKISSIFVLALLAVFLFSDYVMPILGHVFAIIFPLILPFFLAVLLAILLTPAINWLQRKTMMNRGASVAVVLLVAFLIISGIIAVLISHLVKELYLLAADFSNSSYGIDIQGMLDYLEEFYLSSSLADIIDPSVVQESLQNFGNTLTKMVTDFIYQVADWLMEAPSILFMLLVTAFATYYFCKDENMAVNLLTKFMPKKMKTAARDTYLGMIDVFFGYVRAQLILITITAVISMIGFLILRTDYVIVMGLIVGFVDLLPVFGPGAVFVPWSLYCFVSGDYSTGIGLLIVYIVALCVRNVIQPKLIADGIGLHPLATIASLYIGLELFGAWGLIFGPVVLVIVLGALESYHVGKRKRTEGEGNGGQNPPVSPPVKQKKKFFKLFKS